MKRLFDSIYGFGDRFPMKITARILALRKIRAARPSEIFPKRNSRPLATATMGEREEPAAAAAAVPLEMAKTELRRMYEAGVRGVLPSTIVDECVHVAGNELRVSGKSHDLTSNIYLVGFGKAVMGMAVAMEEKLGDRLKRGIVSVPRGSRAKYEAERLASLGTLVDYRENSVDNQPDAETLLATREIVDLAEKLGGDDTLIVLISGGGSALLCMPRPGIRLDAKLELCRKLQNSGADIKELNVVRKRLSMVKGGGLARVAHPARVITLVLSDIVGDPVDLVASGPTAYSENPPGEAISVLKKYRLYDELDGELKSLVNSAESNDDKSLLDARKEFAHVENFVVGNNRRAVEAASREALRAGLSPVFLRNDVVGRVEEVSEAYARLASLVCRAWSGNIDGTTFSEVLASDPVLPLTSAKADEIFGVLENSPGRGVVLLGAGEPTVIVRGSGRGGRNQELALRFSLDWLACVKDDPRLAEFEVTFLSAGTDGQDGPTDATGAFGYAAVGPILRAVLEKLRKLCNEDTVAASGREKSSHSERGTRLRSMLREAEKIQPLAALENSDSYNLYSRFRRGQDLLKTGITGTNVMDLHFILVKRRQCGCKINFDRSEKCTDILEEHDLRTDFEEPSTVSEDRGDEPKQSKLLNLKILDSSMTERCCKKKAV